MTDILKADDFWPRLEDVQAGMLSVEDARPIPMSHYIDRENRCLWFITAQGTDLASSAESGPRAARYIVASQKDRIYATIDGKVSLSQDSEKLDEIWNAIAASWFEEGQRDPDIRLVRFDLDSAEVWATTGALGFLYEIAKAHATDAKPDMGKHGTLSFAA